MKKTVLCHFYNEEWLLPWWLNHHKQFFDHGIMINYQSTDRSVEIIKEICPTWDIVQSKNLYFLPEDVDQEVESIEANLTGWRICLNVPEFLVGNYSRLTDTSIPTNIYAETISFIEPGTKESPTVFDTNSSILEQCNWIFTNRIRYERSIHNYPVKYPEGRHFDTVPTYHDLKIYYYGWASLEPASIKRRMQIQTKTPGDVDPESPHKFTEEQLIEKFAELQKSATFYNL